MGGSVSVQPMSDADAFSSEEKVLIASRIKSKYEQMALMNQDGVDDTVLFQEIANEFDETYKAIENMRNGGDGFYSLESSKEKGKEENKDEYGLKLVVETSGDTESPSNSKKNSVPGVSPTSSSRGRGGSDYNSPYSSSKRFMMTRKMSEHLSPAQSAVVDDFHETEAAALNRIRTSTEIVDELSKIELSNRSISDYISSLKDTESPAKVTQSEFRARRLTYDKQTESFKEPPIVEAKRSKRTSIYASSEIGVTQKKLPPFPAKYMGTFSCHGVEPGRAENGEDTIHEKINQDRGCVVYPFRSSVDEALFLVLDGHGEQGDRIAEFVMRQIVITLEKHPKLKSNPEDALVETFMKTNTALMAGFSPNQYMTSGCTCVVMYIQGEYLYVANAGDSRAVLAYEDETGEIKSRDLSRDHKPDDPEEAKRITSWGGHVLYPPEPGLSARVYLDPEFTMIGLAMARSIGDYAVKDVGVIAEPEVKRFKINDNDRFVVLASDGVWEFISSQEAVDILGGFLSYGCHDACEELIQVAAQRWQEEEGDYRDDITAIVVRIDALKAIFDSNKGGSASVDESDSHVASP